MGFQGYLKGEATEIQCCAARAMCPIGWLCSAQDETIERPLYPVVTSFERWGGEDGLVWTNMRFESHVHIIQSGVFSCMAHVADGEVPFALFGRGVAIGLVELYAPSVMSNMYHMRPLIPGKICTVSSRALRKRLERIPHEEAMRLMCCAFANSSASSFAQSKIVMQRTTYDRIVRLFLCLQDLTQRAEKTLSTFNLTHEDIALIVSSDRVSVTRALHKMEEDGILSLGYKTITVYFEYINEDGIKLDAHTEFYLAETRESSLRSC